MDNGVSTHVTEKPSAERKAVKKKTKPKAKKPKAKKAAPRKHKKGKNFSFKGPGGARERKKLGIHLLIIRVPVAVVKRIDAKLKKKGLKGARGEWCAQVITSASKR
jgi:hypothetical protein